MMDLLIDMLFATATVLFTLADVKQTHKIFKVKKVSSLSFTHYKLKVAALVLMFTGYALSNLIISVVVSGFNLTMTLVALYLMIKYRRKDE